MQLGGREEKARESEGRMDGADWIKKSKGDGSW